MSYVVSSVATIVSTEVECRPVKLGYVGLVVTESYTVLLRFLAHAPLSKHAPLLKCRLTEVNCNIFNIGAPAFSVNSQNAVLWL